MWAKLLAGAGVLALALAFGWLFGNARYSEGREAMRAELAVDGKAQAEAVLASYAKGVAAGQAGSERFASWLQASYLPKFEEVTRAASRYETSPAGAAICFDADGVREANADIATANSTAATAPSGSVDAVSPVAANRDATGRDSDKGTGSTMDVIGGPGLRLVRKEERAPS